MGGFAPRTGEQPTPDFQTAEVEVGCLMRVTVTVTGWGEGAMETLSGSGGCGRTRNSLSQELQKALHHRPGACGGDSCQLAGSTELPAL